MPNEELKPGRIYLHYSSRVGRQVWSYLQADGQFWHAFGPGTTQQINTFDFRLSPEETQKALRKIDPKLAFDVSSMDHKVYLRLESNNTWKLVRTNSVPSIYDSETKLRWEMQWNKYLPVVHTNGDDWVRRADRYAAPDWNQ